MAFSLFGTAFTDGVDVVSAGFLNWVRTNLVKAIDGTGGGAYTPSSTIDIGGQGLGASILRGALTLTGSNAAIEYRFSDNSTAYSVGGGGPTLAAGADFYRFTGALTGTGAINFTLPSPAGRVGQLLTIYVDANLSSDATAVVTPFSGSALGFSAPANEHSFITWLAAGTSLYVPVAWSSNYS